MYIIENDIFTSCGIIIPRSNAITSIKVRKDKVIDIILIIFLLWNFFRSKASYASIRIFIIYAIMAPTTNGINALVIFFI